MHNGNVFRAADTLIHGLCFLLQLIHGIHGMVQRRKLFTDLLKVADHIKVFVSHHMGGEEELCLRLEQSKANLAAATKKVEALRRFEDDKKALRIELEEVKNWEEATEDRLHEAERERAQLGREVRQL